MFETIWQDLRHGTRMLAKNPGFSLVAILSIAIGVGANAAMFSVADGLMLRPLPIPDANGLMTVSATTADRRSTQQGHLVSRLHRPARPRAELRGPRRARELVDCQPSLARRDESARGTYGLAVSAELLRRTSRPPGTRAHVRARARIAWPGAMRVIMLSHETWTRTVRRRREHRRPRDPISTGEPFTVDRRHTEGFTGPDHFLPPQFYVPLAMLPTLALRAQPHAPRSTRQSDARGHGPAEARGASLAQAVRKSDRIGRALAAGTPGSKRTSWTAPQEREMDQRMAEDPPSVALSVILIGLAVAVLLVACANVAGLLTSRASTSARDCDATRDRRQPRSADATADHRKRVGRTRRRHRRARSRLRRHPVVPAIPDRERRGRTD